VPSASQIHLGSRSELSGGDGRWLVRSGGRAFGVFLVDGELHAYESRCPHQGGPVCQGRVMPAVIGRVTDEGAVVDEFDDGEPRLICPWHGWEFDLRTGRCAADPRFGLRKLKIVDRDGDLTIEG
jgi:nitrite reductase (NADH) small subunit